MFRFSVALLSVLLLLPAWGRQQPQVPTVPQTAPPDVAEEVSTFYAAYWKAWKERDLASVAESLADDFVLAVFVPGRGMMQADKKAAIGSARQFFEAVGKRQVLWAHSILAVVPRSNNEAMVALSNDFTWAEGGGGETELSLDVLRKDSQGRWRLVRRFSEKRPY